MIIPIADLLDRLKHNLPSISQLCDNGYDVSFNKGECIVKNHNGSIIFFSKRQNNLYKINLLDLKNQNVTCLVSINNDQWTWYEKLEHASLRIISKLKKHNLVRGLPSLMYKTDIGSFKSKNIVSTSRPLELLHTNLFGPTKTASINGKYYGLVLVGYYSRWTWVMFLTHKDESFKVFSVFYIRV
ncbi:hypothetical protein CR513_56922, partial [Mucuna pruriens]